MPGFITGPLMFRPHGHAPRSAAPCVRPLTEPSRRRRHAGWSDAAHLIEPAGPAGVSVARLGPAAAGRFAAARRRAVSHRHGQSASAGEGRRR